MNNKDGDRLSPCLFDIHCQGLYTSISVTMVTRHE